MNVSSLLRDRTGGVALLLAFTAVPMLLATGVAIDMARLSMAKTALQSAADDAALAGAQAYQISGQSSNAVTVATNYFNTMVNAQGSLLKLTSAVSAVPTTGSVNGVSFNYIKVTASATMTTTFMNLGGITSMPVNAASTAANPNDSNLSTNTTTSYQPVISSGFLSSSAGDWNSVYMYAVPMTGPGGTANFGSYPPLSQFYEIASNCSKATNTNWTSTSPCNTWQGAVVPATQTFPPIAANQPLAFVMFNMTDGVVGGTSLNQYGSAQGNMRFMVTTTLPFGQGPAAADDNPAADIAIFFGKTVTEAPTTYSTVNSSTTPNCSLLITLIDPANPPTVPPAGAAGSCYALNSTVSNTAQYANMTCAQIAGRTFIYWWNDMGGNPDDKDYNDMVFSVTCMPPPANVNGGSIWSGTHSSTTQTVQLTQ